MTHHKLVSLHVSHCGTLRCLIDAIYEEIAGRQPHLSSDTADRHADGKWSMEELHGNSGSDAHSRCGCEATPRCSAACSTCRSHLCPGSHRSSHMCIFCSQRSTSTRSSSANKARSFPWVTHPVAASRLRLPVAARAQPQPSAANQRRGSGP